MSKPHKNFLEICSRMGTLKKKSQSNFFQKQIIVF